MFDTGGVGLSEGGEKMAQLSTPSNKGPLHQSVRAFLSSGQNKPLWCPHRNRPRKHCPVTRNYGVFLLGLSDRRTDLLFNFLPVAVMPEVCGFQSDRDTMKWPGSNWPLSGGEAMTLCRPTPRDRRSCQHRVCYLSSKIGMEVRNMPTLIAGCRA